jgi:hypothetical protein
MTALKLIDWGEEENYVLLGVHTTAEPYRLAYLINKYLKMQFFRTGYDHDVTMPDCKAHYPVYKHEDVVYNIDYFLVPNKYYGVLVKTSNSGGLFNDIDEQDIKVTLIKEYKDVDYLIKICTEDPSYSVKEIILSLLTIPQVISAYELDTLVIKHQDYLIFE